MKTFYRTLCLSLSMYSRIPMPYIEYDENDMRYTFLFFPMVGVIIGALEYGWYQLCLALGTGSVLYAGVATVIPIFITGGFHMDGYIDTMDALSSHMEMERKLEILKDSHVGAFAVIWSMVYFLLMFGAFNELSLRQPKAFICTGFIFVLSRTLSGLAAISFKSATGKHSLAYFSKAGDRAVVKTGLIIYIVAIAALLIYYDWLNGVMVLSGAFVTLLYYYRMSKKQFGGITGDLAGFFLQICELVCLILVMIKEIWR